MDCLGLSRNQISDISSLDGLTDLSWLDIARNDIIDLAALVDNPGLGWGDYVDVTNNPLSGEALTVQIPALQARGVIVDY